MNDDIRAAAVESLRQPLQDLQAAIEALLARLNAELETETEEPAEGRE